MTKEKTATKKTPAKAKAEKTVAKNESATTEVVAKQLYTAEEVEGFEKDFAEFRDWLVNKPYLIHNTKLVDKKNPLQHALVLLEKHAKWTIQTAPGLQRIYDEVKAVSKDAEVYLSSMQLHALWFFLSKVEGEGLNTAKHATLIQDYIGSVHDNYQFDYSRLEYLNDKVRAGHQQVPLSDEGFKPEVLSYDEDINWKKDWEHLQAAVARRKAEVEAEQTEAAEALVEAQKTGETTSKKSTKKPKLEKVK